MSIFLSSRKAAMKSTPPTTSSTSGTCFRGLSGLWKKQESRTLGCGWDRSEPKGKLGHTFLTEWLPDYTLRICPMVIVNLPRPDLAYLLIDGFISNTGPRPDLARQRSVPLEFGISIIIPEKVSDNMGGTWCIRCVLEGGRVCKEAVDRAGYSGHVDSIHTKSNSLTPL